MDSKGFNMPMIRFNENNFSLWKYEMEMILGTKMLLMVINKSQQLEDVGSCEKEGHWKYTNATTQMFIGNNMDEQHFGDVNQLQDHNTYVWNILAVMHE